MLFNIQRLLGSFRHAFRGLRVAWRSEQNFRLQVTAAALVAVAAAVRRLSAFRAAVLVLAIVIVLVLELLNTFFETLVDIVSPRLHHHVALLKDVLAAAVLVAALGAAIVGVLLLWPF